jgi:hypothetical protein
MEIREERACSSAAPRAKPREDRLGRRALTRARLLEAARDRRRERFTLGLVEVVTLVVGHEIDHRALRQVRRLVDDEATIPNARTAMTFTLGAAHEARPARATDVGRRPPSGVAAAAEQGGQRDRIDAEREREVDDEELLAHEPRGEDDLNREHARDRVCVLGVVFVGGDPLGRVADDLRDTVDQLE